MMDDTIALIICGIGLALCWIKLRGTIQVIRIYSQGPDINLISGAVHRVNDDIVGNYGNLLLESTSWKCVDKGHRVTFHFKSKKPFVKILEE